MRDRRWIRHGSLLLGWAVVLAGGAAFAADTYPEGCVSCHTNRQGEADFRLSNLLDQIGHPSVKRVKKVPRDCTRCHSTDPEDGEPVFSQIIHEIHYDVPNINLYVTRFAGDCRNCHEMNVEEGEAQVKNGAKNW
jgi:nitrate/TMAO reductase-like tetraheme cytochrome c subunit